MSDVQVEVIDQTLLPHSLRKLSNLIGLQAALKLTSHYPGVSLYIPTTATTNHVISQTIGITAFKLLIEHYQHSTITLPKLDSIHRQLKHQILIELKNSGESNRSIALKTNYSQRHVERLISSYKNNQKRTIDANL